MENSVKQIPSDVKWDVEFEGHNFHVTMSFDCKDIFDIDILTDKRLAEEYPDDEQRSKFVYRMTDFLRDKIWNDNSIWSDAL